MLHALHIVQQTFQFKRADFDIIPTVIVYAALMLGFLLFISRNTRRRR